MSEPSTAGQPTLPGAPGMDAWQGTAPAYGRPAWGQVPGMPMGPPVPPQGWYWAPQPQQRTKLGHAGLSCTIGAIVLVPLTVLISTTLPYSFGAGRLVFNWTMLVLSLASAIVGTTLSARGMSRRFANRGTAIAGLIIGIVDLVAWLGLIVAIVVDASR